MENTQVKSFPVFTLNQEAEIQFCSNCTGIYQNAPRTALGAATAQHQILACIKSHSTGSS